IFLYWSGDLRDLRSFPTRRSSDLGASVYDGDGCRSVRASRRDGAEVRGSRRSCAHRGDMMNPAPERDAAISVSADLTRATAALRSEEHTSELQSLRHLVCRLLLEK